MYCNSTRLVVGTTVVKTHTFAVFNTHPPLLGCHGEKKMFLRFLNFDVWQGGRLSGWPICSRRIPRVRFLSEQSYIYKIERYRVKEC